MCVYMCGGSAASYSSGCLGKAIVRQMGKDMDLLFEVVGSGSGVKAEVLADEADEDSTGSES